MVHRLPQSLLKKKVGKRKFVFAIVDRLMAVSAAWVSRGVGSRDVVHGLNSRLNLGVFLKFCV